MDVYPNTNMSHVAIELHSHYENYCTLGNNQNETEQYFTKL